MRTAPLPTRVLDLHGSAAAPITAADIKIRLLTTAPEQTGRYVTLSYCWGPDPAHHYRTTRATLAAHTAGIDFAALPLTHREAILTTLALGLRYLWIDALCIVQDSAADWEREAARMATVYSHAHVSLAATSAADPGAGLLAPFQAAFAESDAHGERVLVRLGTQETVEVDSAPLNRRAWALQERELAPRVVAFGAEQWSWSCPARWTTEDGMVDRARSTREQTVSLAWPSPPPPNSAVDGPGVRSVVAAADADADADGEVARGNFPRHSRARLFQYWTQLVGAYSRRLLTYPSDKCKAIAGLAAAFAARTRARYLVGLWAEDLPAGLLWQATARGVRRRPHALPSWSWVSTEGPVMMPFSSPALSPSDDAEAGEEEEHADHQKSRALPLTLLDVEEAWSGVPHASEVLAARLTVEGKVLPARIGPQSETQRLRFHLVPAQHAAVGEVLGETFLDEAEEAERGAVTEVLCLFLYAGHDADDGDGGPGKAREHFAVLLVPAPEHARADGIMAYRRIGIAVIWARSRLGVGQGKREGFRAEREQSEEETFTKAVDAKLVLI